MVQVCAESYGTFPARDGRERCDERWQEMCTTVLAALTGALGGWWLRYAFVDVYAGVFGVDFALLCTGSVSCVLCAALLATHYDTVQWASALPPRDSQVDPVRVKAHRGPTGS